MKKISGTALKVRVPNMQNLSDFCLFNFIFIFFNPNLIRT